jgi:hypothetical protein
VCCIGAVKITEVVTEKKRLMTKAKFLMENGAANRPLLKVRVKRFALSQNHFCNEVI